MEHREKKCVWPLNTFLKSYVCLTMSWMHSIGATAARDDVFLRWRGGMGKVIRNIHKTIAAVWNLSFSTILRRLLKNYLQYVVIMLLCIPKSLSFAYIMRKPVTNVNPSSPLLSLCKHAVHIAVNECLLPLLAALTCPSTCYAVMNQTLMSAL